MKILAIIPARGGSRRIPHKNIKKFNGQPIIKYSIDAAIQSEVFCEIIVSTDDQTIADISLALGAKVPFMRSQENSSDTTSTATVLIEVLKEYKKLGREFDYVCCIYPTSPFLTPERLKMAERMIIEKKADAVFPVMNCPAPIQKALKIEEGMVKMFWPENYTTRTQDMEPSYNDSNQFYFLKTDSFLEQKTLYLKHSLPLIVPQFEGQDINTEEDWGMAELKYELLKKIRRTI
ncbi:MAG: pseudaminic acid cytidylyltransferase [Candidatus Parcubacteria bacterium]|nr:pseudaminic acid cytidylyltransferase [Candidatus Parcubacteria bacterium]